MRPGRARSELTAVFVDRDGVINRKAPDGEYVTSWARFAFLPGALEGLARLAASPLPVIVVTNQRGIARGRMSEQDLAEIHARMTREVRAAGGRIDAIYHCPHEGDCRCRKPGVGMFEQAAERFGLDLTCTAVIGDQPSDMLAAERIGAVRIRVEGGPEAGADHVARDLDAAAAWLLEHWTPSAGDSR
jgi:D-glycero-D-manno-heptose 1,7-bisphosphate phosphatase